MKPISFLLTAIVTIATTPGFLAAASSHQVLTKALTTSPLHSDSPPAVAVAHWVPFSEKGILIGEWDTGLVYRMEDVESQPEILDDPVPPITAIGGGRSGFLLSGMANGTVIMDEKGAVIRRFAGPKVRPLGGSLVLGDRLFGIGIVGRMDLSSLERGELLTQCLAFTVDVSLKDAIGEGIACDPPVDIGSRIAYSQGHWRAKNDGSRAYAVWEGSPDLLILGADGHLIKRIGLLDEADAAPAVSMAEARKIGGDRGDFYTRRSAFRWIQGTLQGPNGTIAVLFREPASRGHRFTIDLYQENGQLSEKGIPIDLGLRSATAWARPLTFPNGKQYVLINEANEKFDGAAKQHVYRIEFAPSKLPASK